MGRRASAVRLRVTARRPASWLALAAAALSTRTIAAGSGAWWPAATLAAGTAVAAAALGGLPREGGAAWAAWRAAWPAAGAVIGWLAAGVDPAAARVPCVALVMSAATAVTMVVATRGGLAPADATACGLAAGLAAAGGACLAAVPALDASSALRAAWPVCSATGWGLVTAAVPLLHRRAVESAAPRRGPLAGLLPRAAMVSALGAMIAFLFLASHLAWGYALVAAGWLLVIALPHAALGPGGDGDAARRALTATAGRRGRTEAAAVRLVAGYAAVLVWPPLVAAVLAGSADAAATPLAIAACIALVAGSLAALSGVALATGCSRDTACAVALCTAVLAGAGLGVRAFAPANPLPGLMLSNPDDPATLPGPWEDPRPIRSP